MVYGFYEARARIHWPPVNRKPSAYLLLGSLIFAKVKRGRGNPVGGCRTKIVSLKASLHGSFLMIILAESLHMEDMGNASRKIVVIKIVMLYASEGIKDKSSLILLYFTRSYPGEMFKAKR